MLKDLLKIIITGLAFFNDIFTECQKCHEAVEVIVTKKQIKAMLKGFKEPLAAMRQFDAEKLKELNK